MAELVDAADSKSVFERSGSSILPRGTTELKKDLEIQGLFFRLQESGSGGQAIDFESSGYNVSTFMETRPIDQRL